MSINLSKHFNEFRPDFDLTYFEIAINIMRTIEVIMTDTELKPKKQRGRPKGSTNKKAAAQVQTPEGHNQEHKKRRFLPTSITNLFIIALLIGTVLLVQSIIKSQDDEDMKPVTVTPAQVTAEEEFEVMQAEADVKVSDNTVAETETAEAEEPKVVVEEVAVEEVDKVKVKAEKPAVKIRQNYTGNDPYNSGGDLDLDGPATRQKYLAGNVVRFSKDSPPPMKVQQAQEPTLNAPSPAYVKKPLPQGKYTDTTNPWNSGGTYDLDNPANLKANR